jgi:hypothetical protein
MFVATQASRVAPNLFFLFFPWRVGALSSFLEFCDSAFRQNEFLSEVLRVLAELIIYVQ